METRFDGLVEMFRSLILDEIGDLPFPDSWHSGLWERSGSTLSGFVLCVWGSARVYIFDNCRTQWTINYHEEDSEVVKAYIRNHTSS